MKKLAVVLVAAMLVFSLAGQAAAFFEDLHLIRTIYDTTSTTEIGSDLGLKALTSYGAYWPPSPSDFVGDLVAKSQFSGGLADLRVAYYGIDKTNVDVWATGFGTGYPATNPPGPWTTDGDGLQMGAGKWSGLSGAMTRLQGYYAGGGTSTFIGSKSAASSYWNELDKAGVSVGSLGGSLRLASFYEVEISLADLLTNGYVDQILYFFNTPTTTEFATEIATIRTYLDLGADGIVGGTGANADRIGTMINPVPIPGSVLLLASGLLGLFGFRRKRA
jgi:hypothetical protein